MQRLVIGNAMLRLPSHGTRRRESTWRAHPPFIIVLRNSGKEWRDRPGISLVESPAHFHVYQLRQAAWRLSWHALSLLHRSSPPSALARRRIRCKADPSSRPAAVRVKQRRASCDNSTAQQTSPRTIPPAVCGRSHCRPRRAAHSPISPTIPLLLQGTASLDSVRLADPPSSFAPIRCAPSVRRHHSHAAALCHQTIPLAIIARHLCVRHALSQPQEAGQHQGRRVDSEKVGRRTGTRFPVDLAPRPAQRRPLRQWRRDVNRALGTQPAWQAKSERAASGRSRRSALRQAAAARRAERSRAGARLWRMGSCPPPAVVFQRPRFRPHSALLWCWCWCRTVHLLWAHALRSTE